MSAWITLLFITSIRFGLYDGSCLAFRREALGLNALVMRRISWSRGRSEMLQSRLGNTQMCVAFCVK